MGRMYTASFNNTTSAASIDLLEIANGANGIIAIHEIGITQETEITDVEEEMLLLNWKSGVTTGSGGAAASEHPILVGDPASSATVETGNTAKAAGGITQYSWYWNVRVPFQQIFTPETRPILSPSRIACLEQASTPNDSITYGGYIVYEEIG
jgi:hypothetical protein